MKVAFEILIKIQVAQPWVDDGLSPRAIKQKVGAFLKDKLVSAPAGSRDLKIELIQVKQIEGAENVNRVSGPESGAINGVGPG